MIVSEDLVNVKIEEEEENEPEKIEKAGEKEEKKSNFSFSE